MRDSGYMVLRSCVQLRDQCLMVKLKDGSSDYLKLLNMKFMSLNLILDKVNFPGIFKKFY